MKWYPNIRVRRITDVSPHLLEELGVKGLILDIDNTLTTHNHPQPSEGVLNWLSQMRASGIKMIVLSNNHAPRVEPFAELLGLEFISEGKKPLTQGFKRCAKALNLPKEQLCIIGDQIFTDIWGGNRFGCHSILVEPMEPEDMLFFRIKRALEKRVLSRGESRRKKEKA